MSQRCFPGLKPKPPTIRTPRVARRIAERIVAAVNPDEFHWERDELPDRIEDVTREIIRVGHPATVFSRLYQQQPVYADTGRRGGHPYGWEGIAEHCRQIAQEIAEEALQDELEQYQRAYGGAT